MALKYDHVQISFLSRQMPPSSFFSLSTLQPILLASLLPVLLAAGQAQAVNWRGKLDVRAAYADGAQGWADGGMGKSRYDSDSRVLGLGQAVLRGDADLLDTVTASVILGASEQHHGVVDIEEAWLGWNPLPSGPWKLRVKAGFFFPPTSMEVDYGGIDWTPSRTISSSAINSWIGEEVRTNGLEFKLSHSGRYDGSPHDFGLTGAVFTGNDPTGTLLAWRGWSVGDQIAGRNAAFRLADLPVYRSTGAIRRQQRTIHPFRELDGRLGYYAGANYAYGEVLELDVLHYDNRGDPMVVKDGQYAWRTRFDHIGAALHPGGDWELLAQAMRGDTLMGPNAVFVDYRAWYLLASHPLWSGRLALRYDRFSTAGHDILPSDPNDEHGHAVALAYGFDLTPSLSLMTELLQVSSERGVRSQIGLRPAQLERSLVTSLRWQF